jgi:hypothetical protein
VGWRIEALPPLPSHCSLRLACARLPVSKQQLDGHDEVAACHARWRTGSGQASRLTSRPSAPCTPLSTHYGALVHSPADLRSLEAIDIADAVDRLPACDLCQGKMYPTDCGSRQLYGPRLWFSSWPKLPWTQSFSQTLSPAAKIFRL